MQKPREDGAKRFASTSSHPPKNQFVDDSVVSHEFLKS